MNAKAAATVLQELVPLAEMFGYGSDEFEERLAKRDHISI